jgi:WhiB family redox-sensing transcriptional regulator
VSKPKLYNDLIKAIQNVDGTPCQDNPDYWDDELPGMDWTTRQAQIKGAKELCLECPVMMLCAEYAVTANEPTGVWGGLSTNDREKLVASK